jgi:FeS assembly SUF system regulator
MIRIAKLTEYAMLILSQMAKDPHSTLSATYLAELLNLSPPTVSKILKMLSESGFVQSVRGSDGGYHLIKNAAEISIADVISAMEGDIAMTECCENAGLCHIDSVCAMRENWKKINNMVRSLLANYSVIDITGSLHDK